jgi:hypothetical protein
MCCNIYCLYYSGPNIYMYNKRITKSQSSWSGNCYWKVEKYKSPGSDQIPAELIQAGGEILLLEIHKLINSTCNKEKLPDQWKESIIVPVNKKGDKTD